MDALATAAVFLFEGFRLDGRGLFRQGESSAFVPVPIGSRALEILGVLVERPGDLVTRDEIMKAVWPGTVVENSNLPVQIAALRRVLDDGRADGSCIQTVPGRGYRFIVPLTPISGPRSGNGVDAPIAERREPQSLPKSLLSPAQAILRRERERLRGGIIAGVIGILLLVSAGLVGWHLRSPGSEEARPAPRLSIVVLPFTNLGNDPDKQYFADGITEDLTTDLSRIADMFVISRNTAFTYRNKPVDAKQIGRELGVRYLLEGSVRRSGNQVRVNAQLIDAETDTHLWAERFDRDMGDLFALQNEITSRIANALNLELVFAEAARPNDQPDALDFILRGRAAWAKASTRDNYKEVIGLFERALALDPQSVEAQTRLANALTARVREYQTDSRAADIERAEGLVGQALALSPRSPGAHLAKALLLRTQNRCDEAIPEYETVLASDRNSAVALFSIGICKVLSGSVDEAIPFFEQSIRLDPRDAFIVYRYDWLGLVHLLLFHTDEAIVWFEKARSVSPAISAPHAHLASAYALRGEIERAAAELAEARRLTHDNRYSSIARLEAAGTGGAPGYWGAPKIRALYEATYFAGLRKAGMPEE